MHCSRTRPSSVETQSTAIDLCREFIESPNLYTVLSTASRQILRSHPVRTPAVQVRHLKTSAEPKEHRSTTLANAEAPFSSHSGVIDPTAEFGSRDTDTRRAAWATGSSDLDEPAVLASRMRIPIRLCSHASLRYSQSRPEPRSGGHHPLRLGLTNTPPTPAAGSPDPRRRRGRHQ